MKRKGSDVISYLVVICCIVFSGLLIYFSGGTDYIKHLLAMFIVCLGACISARFDFWHPYCWYSFFYLLYNIAYIVVCVMDGYAKFGYTKEAISLQWIGISVLLLIVGPTHRLNVKKTIESMELDQAAQKNYLIGVVAWGLKILVLATAIYGLTGGFSKKADLYAAKSTLVFLGMRGALLLNILYGYNEICAVHERRKLDIWEMITCGIPLIAIGLFTGERDRMFIFVVITGYLLIYIGVLKVWHMLALFPIGVIFLQMVTKYKYFFMSNYVVQRIRFDSFTMVVRDFFYSEFYTVGRNLNLLVLHSPETKGMFKGYTIWNDFIRVFFDTKFTHGTWFTENISHTKGYGFTMVGEGYINYGRIGVVLVFVIAGLILRFVYSHASKNIHWMTVYLYTIPVYIYSIRADLGNIFSPLLVHAGAAILIIIISKCFRIRG